MFGKRFCHYFTCLFGCWPSNCSCLSSSPSHLFAKRASQFSRASCGLTTALCQKKVLQLHFYVYNFSQEFNQMATKKDQNKNRALSISSDGRTLKVKYVIGNNYFLRLYRALFQRDCDETLTAQAGLLSTPDKSLFNSPSLSHIGRPNSEFSFCLGRLSSSSRAHGAEREREL